MISVSTVSRSRSRLLRIRCHAVGLALLLWAGAAVVHTAVDFLDLVGRPAPDPESVSVDGIAVFSGSSLRVLAGLRLLRAGRARRLLVAGGDDVEAFRAAYGDLLACCVDLHPASRNTAEDAAAMSRWARARRIGSMLAVTNDVHMPRAMLELSIAHPALRVVAYPVRSRDEEDGFKRHAAVLREYAKWIAVRIMHALARVPPGSLSCRGRDAAARSPIATTERPRPQQPFVGCPTKSC